MSIQSGQNQDASGRWLPLMEYAMQKGVSLSTLRRYIKANKITHRIEGGRYLILDDAASGNTTARAPRLAPAPAATEPASNAARPRDEVGLLYFTINQLRTELKRTHEEIAELKTLIALYEERIPQPKLDV